MLYYICHYKVYLELHFCGLAQQITFILDLALIKNEFWHVFSSLQRKKINQTERHRRVS